MITRLPTYTIELSEDTKERHAIAGWAFQSHNWIEKREGYYHCEWCGMDFAGNSISRDFKLCRENYAIKKLLEEHLEPIK